MDNEVKKLYSALIGKGYTTRDLGDEQTFMGKMQDADNRKQLYDWVNARGDFRIGSYDDYEKRLTAPPAPKAEDINPTDGVEKSGNTFANKIPMVEKLPQIYWTEESIASPKLPEIKQKDVFRESPYRANYEKVKAAGDKRSYAEWLKSLPEAYDNDDVVGENGELLALVPKEKIRSDEYGGLSREQAEFLRAAGHNNDIDAVKAINRKDVRDQVNESFKEITDAWSTTRGIVNDEYYGSRWYGRPLQVFNKITSGTDATDFAIDKDVHAMRAADKLIGEAKSVMDAATEGKGFFAGAGEVLSQWNPVKPLEGLIDADAVESVVRKIEEDKELSYAENALLESFALNAAAHTYYEDEVSNWHNAGKVVGDMIPLAAEMLANPASGMARKWAQATLKRVAGKSLSKATKKALIYAAGTTGAFAGGTTMAATTGLPSVLEEAQRNSTGQAQFGINKNGEVGFTGVKEGGSFGEEFLKSLYRRGVENATEQMGAEWLTKWLGGVAGKAVKVIPGGKKAVEYVTDLVDNKYAHYLGELAEKVNYQGPIEEFVEEIESAVLGTPVDGFESLKGFFEGDNLITTAIAVSVPGFGMGTVNALGGALTGQYKVGFKEKQKRMQAYGRGMEAFADNQSEWNRIVLNINSSSVSDVETELKRVYHSPNYTDEQKQRVLEYAVHSLKYRTLVEAKTAMTDDTTKMLNDMLGSRYSNGYEAADEQKGAIKQAYDMERERVLNTFGEEVVQRLDDDPVGALMELNDVDRQEAIAYVNARTAYEGMIDRISDDIDERVKASDKEIDSHKNRQDGAIHPAMMRGVNGAAPKRVYIVNGNVATFEDGTIDKANSSSMIIVRDAETGEVSAASADDLESLDAVIDTEAEKKSVAEQIANEYAGQQAGIIEAGSGETQPVVVPASGGNVPPLEENAPVVQAETAQPVAQTALDRVPKAENGEPVYEQADAETAWDAIMEQANDEELATQVVEGMIADKGAALKKLENSKVRQGVTVAEKIAAAQQRKAAIEQAKADLAKWQEIAGVKAKRAAAQAENVAQPTAETAPVAEETQPAEVVAEETQAPVVENTPIAETPQAANEMQPAEETDNSTVSQVSDQVSDQVAESANTPGQSGVAEIKEPTFTEEVLENGDKRITKYNSRGEVEAVSTERDGKVISVDSYDEGVLFETTTYDGNGVSTSVTRYDKEGNVIGTQVFVDGKAVPSETTEQPEKVANAAVNMETLQPTMSDSDFAELVKGDNVESMRVYLKEIEDALRVDDASPLAGEMAVRNDYRKAVEQYGGKENIPAEVMNALNERIKPYSELSRALFDRKYALQDRVRELESAAEKATAAKEKQQKVENKNTAFGGFLADKTDLAASTAEKALSKKYNFDGKVMTVAEFVEDAVGNGNVKLSAIEEPKYKGASRAAWNRMDARQQEADAKRVKEGGTKTVYTVNDHDFGKTAYDYAKFLLDKKAEQEKFSQGERSKGKTESESKPKVEKIEDVGEVLAGARKDELKVIASSFENATVKSLVELPFSKAFKKPDLKKAVESGALREEDAVFYEAMFNALVNSSKPKNSTRHRNAVEKWAEETYNSLQLIKSFVEADEATRDRAMADALADKFPAREEELAVIEQRKAWNARNSAVWGDKTTPNPVWVTHEVLKALGYKPGDKVEIPFGVLKANVFATGYELYNKKGDRLVMQAVPTVEEGIEQIVWLSKIKRGDADTMHPVSSFFATPTKHDMGDSGRYYVLYGTVRNPKRSEFGSKEEADAFAANQKEAAVYPVREVVKRYGYKIAFRNPLTGDKFYVNDMEFETEGEAMQYIEENYDAVNEQTNELLAKERGEAKKEVSADDLLEVAMVRGKDGWKYAVNIKGKYANNMGMPLSLREFNTRDEAKAFLNESKNEVFEVYKKQQAEQKKFVFFDTGENSRIGEDYRGGRDVAAQDFMDTFGFRGVQFGNWTNQADRQMAVNQAYDAFLDLAKLLGVSPKALSLNGELGMAFGSRGSGFGNAHYEPGEIVINLTKTRGAGSLAHEWWHALDNYFARRANVPMGMVTDSRSIDMRPELRQAYNELLKMIENSDFYKRSKAKGDYWGRMHEVTARLMAEWVDQSLKDKGELNTFLSRGVNEERYKRMNYDTHRAVSLIKGKEPMSYEEFEKTPEALAGFPYPSREELKEFGDAVRNIFDTVEEQETEEGDVVLYRSSEDNEALAITYDEAVHIADEFVRTHKGAAPTIIINSMETLEEQLRNVGFSEEDIEDAKKDFYKDLAYYHPTYDKIIINRHNVPEAELIGYLWHENAHRAVGKLYTSGEMERVFNAIYGARAQEIREALEKAGYEPLEHAEESIVSGIEELYLDETTRSRLQNGGWKAKKNATEEQKNVTEFINRVINFINNGEEQGVRGRRGQTDNTDAGENDQETARRQDVEMWNSQDTGETPQGATGGLTENEIALLEASTGYTRDEIIEIFGDDLNRQGNGPLTDREVVMESDVYSKVLGKPRYYGKKQREFVARQRRRMAEKARQVAEKLNLNNVEVLESTEGLTGKKATSKGWFDPRTGKITVVVPNHGSTGDIVETVLHEAVAHYGLRKLFGGNFNNFLDNVYRNVTPEIRAEITELAKAHGWDFHTATEEYLASLAENTNFERVNPSVWSNIKSFFMKMLAKVGITLDEPLGDNELRYILWRSHQNLVNPGWFNVFGQAEDIAKQYELGVGNYAIGEVAAEDEIRFSKVTPEMDAEYMAAVENGDMETAERLVKEAAKMAMPDTKVVDEDGYPKVVYHGSRSAERFNVFNAADSNSKALGSVTENSDRFSFFADTENAANAYKDAVSRGEEFAGEGNLYSVYLDIKNPAVVDFNGLNWTGKGVQVEYFDALFGEWMPLKNGELDYFNNEINALAEYRRIFGAVKVDESNWRVKEVDIMPSTNEFAEQALAEGKDGAIIYNVYDSGQGESPITDYVAFSPNQIKSAEAVTYDDNGNVIPLSERFNEEKEDIRFREGGAPGSAREEYERKVRRPNKSGSVGATENVARRAQEAYQDSMLALKILQDAVAKETGNEVKDNENAYIAENRMSSSNKAMVEIYERDFFMPLMDEINALIKEGVEYDDIIRYLHAKHGLERNEYMRRKQAEEAARRELGEEPAMPNEGDADYEAKVNAKAAWRANLAELTESYVKKFAKRDYSGLTALTESANAKDAEAAAQQMVDEFENDHETTPLWEAVNKATKETLRREFVGGLIDRATYDTVSTMFDFYIPLRGWDKNVAANEYEYFTNNNTPVFTPAIKTMHGRKSLADDPIATIGYMAGSAIARANRNLMKQKFLNFVMNNPTSLATVSEQWYTMDYGTNEWVPNNPAIPEDATPEQVVEIVEAHEANMRALEKAGLATRERSGLKIGLHATKQEQQQHVVRVMRNGKEYAVYINGNPRAAQALNGMTNPDVSKSKAWEAAQNVKNFMARAFTSRNPAFIISNSARDVIWAGTAVAAKEDAEYTKQYTKNVTAVLAKFKLPRLLKKFQNGTLDMDNEIERYFDEFLRNGGETGFTQVLTAEDYKKNIARFTKEAKNGTRISKKAWRGLWNGIEFLNRNAEDITRFTVYMTSRQMGRSIDRSVYDAKEITVNFNKKGSGEMGARYLNFAYIFFNATIQSLANFGKLVYRHPGKMAAALGTFGMMGFLMPVINAALMALGDDDDEENYWNLPEWVRRNNIVLFVPWTEKGFITIPLPHEIRPFYGMGENAMSALLGKQTTEDAIKKSLVGFTGMLPIDFTANGGDVVVNVMPTILQPLAQVRANVTHFGTPIYKDNDFNKRYPSWTKAYKGTNSTLVAATKWLNELGGGNNVDSGGLLDWNPAVIEHIFESYLGGMGKTFNKAATTVSMLWDEEARIARNIPVASSFYQEIDERTAGSQLNREYFDALEEMKGFQHRMSGYQKEITKGNAEYETLFEDLVNSDEFMRYGIIKDYSNAISELDQVLKNNGPTEEEAQEIEGVIQELKKEMLDELEKLQAEE